MPPDPTLKNLLRAPAGPILRRYAPQLVAPCFAFWALSNFIFSHANLSVTLRIWVALLGLSAWLFLFFYYPLSPKKGLEEKPFPVPVWVWVVLGAAALFLRFFRLACLSAWPTVDEGNSGYFAIRLMENWNWAFLQGTSQTPMFFAWGQALLFKIFSPSLLTLWLYPALWSLLTIPVSWLAARRLFPPVVAVLVVTLTALSFWPLLLGRYCTQSVLLVFWEWLVFYLLARLIQDPPGIGKRGFFWLGLATGIGFYTYLSWGVVALLVALIAVFHRQPSILKRAQAFGVFTGTLLLVISPLFFSFLTEYRGYFHHLWAVHSYYSWLKLLHLALAYAADPFWGSRNAFFHFGPVWGGLLNPLLGAFCFLGFIPLLRDYRNPTSFWLVAASLIFFLPALLTNDFETMRLCQLMPVLTVVTAFGIQALLSNMGRVTGVMTALVILFGSVALDSYHLFSIYADHWKNNPAYYGSHKSMEFNRTYPILKSEADRLGPGWIFLNFHPDPYDQTLFVATYAFNAAENPALDPAAAKWAAFLVNVHEEAALAKSFPGGKGLWLSEGLNRADGGSWLEWVELSPRNRETLARWLKADQSLKELNLLVMEQGVTPYQGGMLGVLEKSYPFFRGDPFLESRYWRIVALHDLAAGNTPQAIENEEKAASRGFPQAHLYNEMGCLLFKEGKKEESGEAFRKALRLKPNYTNAADNLQGLAALKK